VFDTNDDVPSTWDKGNRIVIDNLDGKTAQLYLHIKKGSALVQQRPPGQEQMVEAGQQIALAGNSGHSTAIHLHFAIQEWPGAPERTDWYRTSVPAYFSDPNIPAEQYGVPPSGLTCYASANPSLTQPPTQVSTLSAAPVSSSAIRISWTYGGPPATAFRVMRWTGLTWQLVTTINDGSARSYDATGLQPATGYTYTVDVINSAGEAAGCGSPCRSANATTLAAPSTVLYQADWSVGPNGWTVAAGSFWGFGLGTASYEPETLATSLSLAPYQPTTSNYVVEAEIQTFAPLNAGAGYGLATRWGNSGGYRAT
jgi:hypothetical protein